MKATARWATSPLCQRSCRLNCSRGTNHRREPLRRQIEQLQEIAPSISPSTSNATLPQWQLPLCIMSSRLLLASQQQLAAYTSTKTSNPPQHRRCPSNGIGFVSG